MLDLRTVVEMGGLRDGQIWDYPHAKVPQRRNIGDLETQPTRRRELGVYAVDQDGQVEKAKKQMRQKLVRDFSAEQKENVKDEAKKELDAEYKAHISSLSDDLMIEKQKHKKTKKELVEANKVNDSLTKMNIDYIENYVPKEELDKVNHEVNELRKENKTLKAWKEKALNWIDKHVEKVKKISFFQHVGGIQKRNKRQDQEMER